jgi:protein disulfide-isomerase A6
MPRALLLNQGKHIPMLWQVMSVRYHEHIKFALHRDRQGRSSEKLGFEKGPSGSAKVLIYPAGSTNYVRYEGTVVLS